MSQIRIAGIVKESIVDGPGLRYTVFVQGCPHRCPECHNPHTHPREGGNLYHHEELLADIARNPLLQGVTISGGEPLAQARELIPFAEGVRGMGKNLWIYTGYIWESLLHISEDVRLLIETADILVDGSYIQSASAPGLIFRGSSNQRIIDAQTSLREGQVVLANY